MNAGVIVKFKGLVTHAHMNGAIGVIGTRDRDDPLTMTHDRIPVLPVELILDREGYSIDPATVQMVNLENIEVVDVPVSMSHQERCDWYIIAYEQQHGLAPGTLQLATAAGETHRTRICALRNLA